MLVEQIVDVVNQLQLETLGQEAVENVNIENVISIAKTVYTDVGIDNYVRKLVNHIGKVVFVNRPYKAKAPNVLMDGWEFGSILEKIDSDLPDSQRNESWNLRDGETYNQDTFKGPKNVRAFFFNDKTTYEIQISVTEMQVQESFSNINQLNGFFSMIFTKINNRIELDNRNLIMATINNMIVATIYRNFSSLRQSDGTFNFGNNSKVSAINLLGLYKETNPDHLSTEELALLTAGNCIQNLKFIKFASYQIALASERMSDYSTLFNIGNRERFTPKDFQKLVLLSEFAKSADVYLQSDTFHEEYTKLPNAETVVFWQGTGRDYAFSSTSKIHITNDGYIGENINITEDNPIGTMPDPSGSTEIQVSGILGCLFDRDALGINNYNQRVPSHYNAKGEFVNYFYKVDARYFNDYNENFIVFFVA